MPRKAFAASSAHKPSNPSKHVFPERTCVYRYDLSTHQEININDEIGLPSYGSYSVAQYLRDVAEHDGKRVIRRSKTLYWLTDNSVWDLREVALPVDQLAYLEAFYA